jgi:hypothetical protein
MATNEGSQGEKPPFKHLVQGEADSRRDISLKAACSTSASHNYYLTNFIFRHN